MYMYTLIVLYFKFIIILFYLLLIRLQYTLQGHSENHFTWDPGLYIK